MTLMHVADTIFFGGEILTVDTDLPTAEAIAVSQGRILALGSHAEVFKYKGVNTKEVNLQGKTILPGFVEAHAHPFGYGRIWGAPLINIRASHIPSYDAVIATIQRAVSKARSGQPLVFVGLDALRHTGMREPSLAELDEYAPENPLAVYTFNFHSLFVNSKMMQLIGLDEDTKDFPGGKYFRDAHGKLTGKMVEFAAFKNFQSICNLFGDERAFNELRNGLMRFALSGITTVGDIGIQEGAFAAYKKLFEQEPLPIRLRIYERASVDGPPPQTLTWGGNDVKVIGVKVWADGSPFVGTAWLSRPYLNSEVNLKGLSFPHNYHGHMNFDAEFLEKLIDRYAGLGCHIGTHVQGDQTIDVVLEIYAKSLQKYGKPKLPYRLEHCGTMREDQIRRALDLGVVCSFFVPHVFHWGDPIRDSLIGAERAADYMPAGTATRMGMRLSYHSDAPMTEPDPLLAIQTAVTRRTASGTVLGPHQCVDIDAAIKAMTIDAAFQLGMEDEVGSIAIGKRADFVVLRENPQKVGSEKLASIEVCGTWRDGRQIWQKN
jgi:predicted amidohydrolase YtcJ